MMNITTSPDITKLQVQAVFDLSPAVPVIHFLNQSEGPDLVNVSYIFEVYSPNNVPVHVGDFSIPDITGEWVDFTLPETLPTFQQSVEWSGYPYRVIVRARDLVGTVYTLPEMQGLICPPAGNKAVGGNYGEGVVEVTVDCARAGAFIRDKTAYFYQGRTGTLQATSSVTVLQPPGPDGVMPPPQVFTGFSQVAFPLTFTGEDFKVVLQSVVDYRLGELDTSAIVVRFKYIKTQKFDVTCNYDLCPILYEFARMLEQAEMSCDARLQSKILRINSLIIQAVIVKLQPTCSLKLGDLIEEIKKEGGWQCDCNCSTPQGLNGGGAGTGDLNIQFLTDGDISAAASVTGSNILLTLRDFRYVINVSGAPGNGAFSIIPAVNGRVKTFTLNVNLDVLASDLLVKIGSVPALLDAFNALVRNTFSFSVDGKCIMANLPPCDFLLTLTAIPFSPAMALFKSITINDIIYPINVSFNTTVQITTLEGSLNALGKGQFTVAVTQGVLRIVSVGNSNDIRAAVVFGAGVSSDRLMDVAKSNCQGTTSVSPSTIVQAIIDHICGLFHDRTTPILPEDVIYGTRGKTLDFDKWGLQSGQWTQYELTQAIIKIITNTQDPAFLATWCVAVGRCGNFSAQPTTTIPCVAITVINASVGSGNPPTTALPTTAPPATTVAVTTTVAATTTAVTTVPVTTAAPTTTARRIFNTILTFNTQVQQEVNGMVATVLAPNGTIKLEFDLIPTTSPTPNGMDIYVGVVNEMVTSFHGEYLGQPARFTSLAGVEYETNFVFINGNKLLT